MQQHAGVPFEFPPPLRLGDRIAVIAPAGAFDRALFFRGLGWLGHYFRVQYQPDIFQRGGVSAGTPQRRLQELNAALRSETVQAIWCARGGYGSSEISALADFRALLRAPKYLIGFSDITAFHTELSRLKLASLHASNITGVGLAWDPVRASTLDTLLEPQRPRRFEGLETLYPGETCGTLSGGNLTIFLQELSLGRALVPDGAILFLEEVNEAPYRVARQLAALERLGAFDRAGGVVFCQMSAHYAERDPAYRAVLSDFARRVRIPTRFGFPSGHHLRCNQPIVFGSQAAIADDHVVLNAH